MVVGAGVIDLDAIDDNTLYPQERAGLVLNKSPKTLANLRAEGRGPAWHRIGNTPFYLGRDLLAFIAASRVTYEPQTSSRPRRVSARGKP